MSGEAQELAAIRARLAAISPGDWREAADAEGAFLETRTARGMLLPVARFDLGATPAEREFVVAAPAMVAFLLALVERAIARLRADAPSPEAGAADPAARRGGHGGDGDLAAQCAMTCAEPAFRVYLEACHGLERPLTDERVAQKVRSILGVASRRALNDSDAAAARWRHLRRAFQAWRRAG